MRAPFVLLLLLAGCTTDSPVADAEAPLATPDEAGDGNWQPTRFKQPLAFSGTTTGAGGCALVTQCPTHTFNINETWIITVTLAWGNDVEDLDLTVTVGQQIASSVSIQTNTESVTLEGTGPVRIEVQPYTAIMTEYTVDVTFAQPKP